MAAKEAVLATLPESTSAEERDLALSDFYGKWLAQESSRQAAYTAEWRGRNWSTILLGARVQCQKFISRIADSSVRKKTN
ncbi:hypothetical protein A0H81_04266 [Grifola frondosa]|uniref:Uncharacterized protein n=1 Tax=Grifola frondosa TaxID=5627 RepID=A0A1C7MEN8_GRIFR|nr:hypothetical protein A0H81_04266 [Grifola frondosa]